MTDQRDRRRTPAISEQRAEALMVLAALQETPVGDHPNDDMLAAWHEHALDTTAAAGVERHIAHCDRCFAVWIGLLTLEPVPQQTAAPAWRGWLADLISTRAGLGRLGVVAATVLSAIALSVVMFDRAPRLPGYTVSLEGNTSYFRDGAPTTGETARFQTGNLFRLVLKPDTAYDGAVDAALYLVGTDNTPNRLATPAAQVSDTGAVRIDAEVGSSVTLPTGDAQLLVVVGKRGRLPDGARLQHDLRRQTTVADIDWRAWRIPIEVVCSQLDPNSEPQCKPKGK